MVGATPSASDAALWVVVLVKALTPPVWSSPSGVFSWLQMPQSSEEPATLDPPEELPPAPILTQQLMPEFPADSFAEDLQSLPPDIYETVEQDEVSPILAEAVVADSKEILEQIEPAVTQAMEPEIPPGGSFWNELLLMVWITGALGSMLLAIVRWLACWREIRRAGRVHDPSAQELLEQLRIRLGVRRRVRLIISQSRIGPAVLGFFRPTVLIPARVMEGKSAADLEPILAHELIHVRRGDLWVGWLQVLVEAVWWFHPLVHLAGRWLKHEAERCCDEEVIAELGCKPARYARVLLDVLELKHVLKPVPVLPGVKPVEITSKRLERIMLLGQGCRKRTPWWCWLVMLLTAALTLPGAAFVAEAKDKSKRKERREEQADPPANLSAARTETYKVGDVIQKIKTQFAHPDEAAARTELAATLKLSVGEIWQEEEWLSSEKHVGTPSLSIKGNTLTVHHTPRVQAEIVEQLKLIREYGFQQIIVEARILTVSREVLENAVDSWESVSAEIPAGDQPGPKPESVKRLNFAVTAGNGLRTTVEKSTPLRMAILNESQLKKLIENCQADARSNLLFCPKVTVFNGQSATIQDTTQRPFVVGLSPDGKPALRVVSEGTTLKLRPVLEEKQIRLESQLTLSDIRSVEVVDLPTQPGEEAPLKVQVPEVATTRINTTVKVPDGGSVLLGGLKLPDQERKPVGSNILLSSLGLTDKPQKQDQQLFVLLTVRHLMDRPTQGQWEESFEKAQAKARHDNIPLLLYFHAGWCEPCRTMERDVLQSSKFRSMVGYKFRVVKIDIDQHRELAARFNIKSVPTTVFVSPDSKELDRIVGIQSLIDLVSRIDKVESRPNPPAALHHQSLPYDLVLNLPLGFRQSQNAVRHANLEYQKALEAWRQAKVGGSEDEVNREETEVWRKRELWEQAKKDLERTKQISGAHGVGLNIDAGLTGQIVLNEKNFEIVTIDPPTDAEVLDALSQKSKEAEIPFLNETERKNVVILKEKLSQSAEPARVYPLVGPAQVHLARFKCTVIFDEVQKGEWPIPTAKSAGKSMEFLIDKSRVVRVKSVPQPSPKGQVLPSAAYRADDVQYFPAPPESQLPPTGNNRAIQEVVDDFNTLYSQKRFAEAEVVARTALKSYPENNSFEAMQSKARFAWREATKNQPIAKAMDDPVIEHLHTPFEFPSPKSWKELTQSRTQPKQLESEKAIEKQLTTKITLQFTETPLREVMKHLATKTGMNIVVDNLGLAEEGLKPDHPLSIDLEDVKLSTALKVMLEQHQLAYEIQEEVLKITSKNRIENAVLQVVTYHVADLVIPVPQRVTLDLRGKAERPEQKPSAEELNKTATNIADADSLIQLIQSTIHPDSWSERGGSGAIRFYETTLSLVVRQPPKVHEQLRDLLEQLRRLQDLQVSLAIRTIELQELPDKELAEKMRAGKPVALTPDQAAKLVESVNRIESAKRVTAPKVTLFNGQTVQVLFPTNDGQGLGMDFSPVISADRRFVRLGLSTNPQNGSKRPSNVQSLLKDGHSLLLNLTKPDDKTINKGQTLVLLTPQIIVQEEEEEQLGVTKRSGKTIVRGLPLSVASPTMIIQEEEELLGIEP